MQSGEAQAQKRRGLINFLPLKKEGFLERGLNRGFTVLVARGEFSSRRNLFSLSNSLYDFF